MGRWFSPELNFHFWKYISDSIVTTISFLNSSQMCSDTKCKLQATLNMILTNWLNSHSLGQQTLSSLGWAVYLPPSLANSLWLGGTLGIDWLDVCPFWLKVKGYRSVKKSTFGQIWLRVSRAMCVISIFNSSTEMAVFICLVYPLGTLSSHKRRKLSATSQKLYNNTLY